MKKIVFIGDHYAFNPTRRYPWHRAQGILSKHLAKFSSDWLYHLNIANPQICYEWDMVEDFQNPFLQLQQSF